MERYVRHGKFNGGIPDYRMPTLPHETLSSIIRGSDQQLDGTFMSFQCAEGLTLVAKRSATGVRSLSLALRGKSMCAVHIKPVPTIATK